MGSGVCLFDGEAGAKPIHFSTCFVFVRLLVDSGLLKEMPVDASAWQTLLKKAVEFAHGHPWKDVLSGVSPSKTAIASGSVAFATKMNLIQKDEQFGTLQLGAMQQTYSHKNGDECERSFAEKLKQCEHLHALLPQGNAQDSVEAFGRHAKELGEALYGEGCRYTKLCFVRRLLGMAEHVLGVQVWDNVGFDILLSCSPDLGDHCAPLSKNTCEHVRLSFVVSPLWLTGHCCFAGYLADSELSVWYKSADLDILRAHEKLATETKHMPSLKAVTKVLLLSCA